MTPNGWRLGVRAGERKSLDGRQTFKFPQNFPRAYTPHDAKPLVSCLRGRFALRLIKRTFHFARYEFSLIFSELSRFVEVLDSAQISIKVSNCIYFILSNFPILLSFMQFFSSFTSAEIGAKISNCICFLLSNFPISPSFMQLFQSSHFSRNSRKNFSCKPQKTKKAKVLPKIPLLCQCSVLLLTDR